MSELLENKISFAALKDKILSHEKAPLVEAMCEYKNAPMTGFHIPGHNRGEGIFPKFLDLVGSSVLSIDFCRRIFFSFNWLII